MGMMPAGPPPPLACSMTTMTRRPAAARPGRRAGLSWPLTQPDRVGAPLTALTFPGSDPPA
jgi:hypothetical protein